MNILEVQGLALHWPTSHRVRKPITYSDWVNDWSFGATVASPLPWPQGSPRMIQVGAPME